MLERAKGGDSRATTQKVKCDENQGVAAPEPVRRNGAETDGLVALPEAETPAWESPTGKLPKRRRRGKSSPEPLRHKGPRRAGTLEFGPPTRRLATEGEGV